MFGVNGEERGLLFAGVKTDILLWALMDVFGNTTAIELVGMINQISVFLYSLQHNKLHSVSKSDDL